MSLWGGRTGRLRFFLLDAALGLVLLLGIGVSIVSSAVADLSLGEAWRNAAPFLIFVGIPVALGRWVLGVRRARDAGKLMFAGHAYGIISVCYMLLGAGGAMLGDATTYVGLLNLSLLGLWAVLLTQPSAPPEHEVGQGPPSTPPAFGSGHATLLGGGRGDQLFVHASSDGVRNGAFEQGTQSGSLRSRVRERLAIPRSVPSALTELSGDRLLARAAELNAAEGALTQPSQGGLAGGLGVARPVRTPGFGKRRAT